MKILDVDKNVISINELSVGDICLLYDTFGKYSDERFEALVKIIKIHKNDSSNDPRIGLIIFKVISISYEQPQEKRISNFCTNDVIHRYGTDEHITITKLTQ